jgi:hypothetical protein
MYGFANIQYNTPTLPSDIAGLIGGNNGLSKSTLDPAKIVFGQNVGQAGDPSMLLNNREIPMQGFQFNFIDGSFVISNVPEVNAGEKFLIQGPVTGAVNDSVFNINLNYSNVAEATAFRVNIADTYPTDHPIYNPFLVLRNGFPLLRVDQIGDVFVGRGDGAFNFQLLQMSTFFNLPQSLGAFTISQIYQFNTRTTPNTFFADILSRTTVSDTIAAADVDFMGINLNDTLSRSGTGNTWGFLYNPVINDAGAKHIGIENTSGDVYLNSTAGANIGRTGIHGIRTPTAWLHLGAGAAAASSAPLKFTAGTNQTTAEAGALEYNGTNFFATRTAGNRETLFTGTSGATAPATTAGVAIANFYGSSATNYLGTPNSWASVVIGGTTYKIPLYT